MSTPIQSACSDYLEAWATKDLDRIAERLHPDVQFKGPMREMRGRDEVLASSKSIFQLLDRFEVRDRFVDGDRAIFVYDFVCRAPIGVCPTAELVRFEDGLIREITLFYDARPFEAMQRARSQAAA